MMNCKECGEVLELVEKSEYKCVYKHVCIDPYMTITITLTSDIEDGPIFPDEEDLPLEVLDHA